MTLTDFFRPSCTIVPSTLNGSKAEWWWVDINLSSLLYSGKTGWVLTLSKLVEKSVNHLQE